MHRPAPTRLALTLLAAAGAYGCDAQDGQRPDLLLVTIDTLRADHVSAYGHVRETTPYLDALADEGALFEVAYAPMGTTSPSHATLFTSRHPLAHGLVRNGFCLVEEELTLAEILTDRGYRCGAFVSSFPVSQRFGFAQGFASFDDRFEPETTTVPIPESWEGNPVEGGFDRRATATVDAALAWHARQGRGTPRFLWVHLFDPHDPYAPPPEHAFRRRPRAPLEQRMKLAYDGEVRYADAELGRLVSELRSAPGARPLLVVVTSDHGEGLLDHGHQRHNRTLYDEEVRVPLVITLPGEVRAGARIDRPVQLIDVAPTVLGLLGVLTPTGAALDGRDLSRWLRGADSEPGAADHPLLLQRPWYAQGRPRFDERGPGFGLRRGPWKLIEAPEEGRRELYDLESDPAEKHDLAAAQPERARALAEEAVRLREAERAKRLGDAQVTQSPEVLQRLRAMGYVDGE